MSSSHQTQPSNDGRPSDRNTFGSRSGLLDGSTDTFTPASPRGPPESPNGLRFGSNPASFQAAEFLKSQYGVAIPP
ncbi:hypothetical protein I203_102102 [Kwoniella mangroviensis CBS 8507]|uniref:uncharacterized protein n=1 Tax=Kwoniella mangroviensis CBS 8507 TaxID=1296122 RepID=UPI0030703D31